jgi:hypothetical protein
MRVAIAQIQPERAILAENSTNFTENLHHALHVFLRRFLQAKLRVDPFCPAFAAILSKNLLGFQIVLESTI